MNKEELKEFWGEPPEGQAVATQKVIERIFNNVPPPYEETIEYHVDLFKQGFDKEFERWKDVFFFLVGYNILIRDDEMSPPNRCGCCRYIKIEMETLVERPFVQYTTISSNCRAAKDEEEFGCVMAKNICVIVLNNNLDAAKQYINLNEPDNAWVVEIKDLKKNGDIVTETYWSTEEVA